MFTRESTSLAEKSSEFRISSERFNMYKRTGKKCIKQV